MIDQLTVGAGEELLGFAETTRVDQRTCAVDVQGPLVPGFVGLGRRSAVVGWGEQLGGVVEAAEPGQAVADHQVCGAEPT